MTSFSTKLHTILSRLILEFLCMTAQVFVLGMVLLINKCITTICPSHPTVCIAGVISNCKGEAI